MRSLIVVVSLMFFAGGAWALNRSESPWLAQIRSEDPEVRECALEHLRERLERGDADAETVQAFLLAGLETDHVLRMQVSDLIDLVPPQATSVLIPALSDPRPAIRAQAAGGLGGIGPDAIRALDHLLELLRDPDQFVRTSAAVAISRVDAQGLSFPYLLAMAQESHPAARLEAAVALDRFGERVRPLVAELLPLLGDHDENVRYWLVNVVANVKHTEPEVVEVLARLLREDESAFVRERTAREFWEMGVNKASLPPFAITALVRALDADPNDHVREQSAKALASNPPLRKQNRAVLKQCVERESDNLRDVCRDSLKGECQ